MTCVIEYDKITETVQYLQDRFNLAVELRPYQFEQIENTLDVEEEYNDEIQVESDEFLNRLDEANKQEEERRRLEEERIAEEERLLREKREQESNNAKMLIEKRRQEVRGKFNTLISMLNKYIDGKYEWKDTPKMGQTDSDVKVVEDEDGKYYLTKIDATHFYLSNNSSMKGMAFSIFEFRESKWYDEVKSWLKENNSKMSKGGKVISSFEKGGILTHKHSHTWGETITIRLIEPTSKGWKVEQMIKKGKSSPKTKIAFFSKEDIKDLFE
jgi:hypothetical protein